MISPVYCPVAGEWYEPAPKRLPRVRLTRHQHRCPDGTWVVATAQYIWLTDTTLYRMPDSEASYSMAGDVSGAPPDWSAVDALHPQQLATA
jgi:hypothetical protein